MGLRNLNFLMRTVRSESWRISMEAKEVMKKGISKCVGCDFCSPGFN